MKNLFDILQVLLSNWIGCVIFVLLIMQVWKLRLILVDCVRALRRYVLKFNKFNLLILSLGAFLVILISKPLNYLLQDLEYKFVNPVWFNQYSYLSNDEITRKYEAYLSKKVDANVRDSVIMWTRHTASRIGTTPDAIYMTALLECGMDPFNLKNPIAAGWIQFTSRGLKSSGVSLDRVKRACREKDIGFIMRLPDY